MILWHIFCGGEIIARDFVLAKAWDRARSAYPLRHRDSNLSVDELRKAGCIAFGVSVLSEITEERGPKS